MKKILHYEPFTENKAVADSEARYLARTLVNKRQIWTSNILVVNHARLLVAQGRIDRLEIWFYGYDDEITEVRVRRDGTAPDWPNGYNWEFDVTMKILEAQKELRGLAKVITLHQFEEIKNHMDWTHMDALLKLGIDQEVRKRWREESFRQSILNKYSEDDCPDDCCKGAIE